MLNLIPIFFCMLLSLSYFVAPSCVPEFRIVPASEINNLERIEWSERRLSWDDFQAQPDRDSWRIAAVTSSVIQYRYHCKDGLLNYEVKSIFLKDESWVKDNARTTNYLAHEQLHFDITEVFARNLRKELSKRTFRCNEAKAFERSIQKVLDEWKKTQTKYDRETQYSLDKPSQREWMRMVDELLSIEMKGW